MMSSSRHAFPRWDGRFWIHDALEGCPHSVASQNPAKDTLGYHAIQHQKTQWLDRTSHEFESDVLVWLDFGILINGFLNLPISTRFFANAPHLGLGGVAILIGYVLAPRTRAVVHA